MPNVSVKKRLRVREVSQQPPSEKIKKRVVPGILFALGYILSPLSWWNDLFINLPLAWLLGTIMNFFLPGSFKVAMIVAYWLSNLSGILFMFWGGSRLLGKPAPKQREMWISAIISLAYTLALYFLMQCGIVRPFEF